MIFTNAGIVNQERGLTEPFLCNLVELAMILHHVTVNQFELVITILLIVN